jgi:hypothetical protein
LGQLLLMRADVWPHRQQGKFGVWRHGGSFTTAPGSGGEAWFIENTQNGTRVPPRGHKPAGARRVSVTHIGPSVLSRQPVTPGRGNENWFGSIGL